MSPRNLSTASLLAGLLALAPLAAGTPGSTEISLDPEVRATIRITPVAERWSGEGFMPVTVRIENHSDRAREWTLRFVTDRAYTGEAVRQEVAVGAEAGGTTETVVFVPGGASGDQIGASLRVEAEGPGTSYGYGQFVHTTSDPILITATTPAQESALFAATNGAPGPKTEISAVDPARWPADWRTWSPFRRVVLTDAEFAALDGARRAALRDWVAMGGTLDLYPARGRGEAGVEPVGHGAIRRLAASVEEEAALHPAVELHAGPRFAMRDAWGAEITPERRKALQPGTGALGLSFFLLGFGILVGPINLFVFAPAHRRQRLFVTVPLISLAASALMAGYIVVKDGFGGEGSQRGLVLLLPEGNRAVVSQHQVARTGVLLGGGFGLPEDVAMAQLTAKQGPYRGDAPAGTYLRAGAEAGGDWFASRRVQEQALRRLVPTRARVELVAGGRDGAAPVVQSSIGTVLRDFRYVDGEGRLWTAPEVAPGVKVPLRRGPEASSAGMPQGFFAALGGAAEGLAPIPTLDSIRWDAPEFLYAGPLTGARTP